MSDGDDIAADILELFEIESEDYLAAIEDGLSGTAADLQDPDTIGRLFRAFHSLKGICASLNIKGIETLSHHGEDLLDVIRSGDAQADEGARGLLLETADALLSMRDDIVQDWSSAGPADQRLVDRLIAAKASLLRGEAVDPTVGGAGESSEEPGGDFSDEIEAEGSGDVEAVTDWSFDEEPEPGDVGNEEVFEEDDFSFEASDEEEDGLLDDDMLAASASSVQSAEEEEDRSGGGGQKRMAVQVSRERADPSEREFRPDNVSIFDEVVASELGQMAEALEASELGRSEVQEIEGSLSAMRQAAHEAGFFGIVEQLSITLEVLEDGETVDRTLLTRCLCDFVHRLRVIADLSDVGSSIENVEDSLAPHITREAREVVDRLSIGGGDTRDWELVGILARALGVYRVSALARLVSELTMMEDWRDRPNAGEIVEKIRQECQVVGIEGLNVASLDMIRDDYDKIRDEMALLLTNAGASVAALRKTLGDEIFNSLSPAARTQIADFLEKPGARLVEVQALLPEGGTAIAQFNQALEQFELMSNRILIDIDPELYQFLVGVIGPEEALINLLEREQATRSALREWGVLTRNPEEAPAAAAASKPAAAKTEQAKPVVPKPTPQETGTGTPPARSEPDQKRPRKDPPKAVEVAAAEKADRAVPEEKSDSSSGRAAASSGGSSSLRVSSELIDNYLDSVSELRLCLSRLDQGASEAGLATAADQLRNLVTETDPVRRAEQMMSIAAVIDNASKIVSGQIARAETSLRSLHGVTLDLRVVPISIVLGRIPRLVHDLSRSLAKQVNLEIEDGDIQIDKSMVDALMEPLVHMIRNAMDHGIESSDDRQAVGKPPKAKLSIRATQNGNVAQIMIGDDGRGLNTARIRSKALERGLITEQDAARMSEREIQRQIFAPGFSTASAVTETSGRGVGMDVVLVTIRRLGGSIDIESVEGEGTRFFLNFPISAALQRIVVLNDGKRDFGIPERSIVEVIEVKESEINTVGEMTGIQHRDGFLPVGSLTSMLGWPVPEAVKDQSVFPVVIVGPPQRRIGIAFSRVRRRQEVFMKELHPALQAVDVLAGATVIGEGQPLLVLDPETLIAISGA